jgi:hypothetical protein
MKILEFVDVELSVDHDPKTVRTHPPHATAERIVSDCLAQAVVHAFSRK